MAVDDKMAEPMQYASGYSTHFYCDHEHSSLDRVDGLHCFEGFGETFADCARQARRAGWTIRTATRTATCPKHAKRKANK